MQIKLNPETERLVQEEIACGHFQSVDELIMQGLQALRERDSAESTHIDLNGSPADAVARLRALRKGLTLRGLKIKNLAHEGHRF
jgi:Arc/MetJ-type ribon-helix-helix transcriptional regulator